MTDIDVSFLINSGRIFSKMDFNYSAYQPASSLLHHELLPDDNEDEDLDSFYMDMPPIDMVERLKEVNKAHTEDPTPVECERTTTIRFKDIIAEFQSPRESESDDGYGDSSDIMYDPEEEIDNLCEGTEEEHEEIFDSHTVPKYSKDPAKIYDLSIEEFSYPAENIHSKEEIKNEVKKSTPFSSTESEHLSDNTLEGHSERKLTSESAKITKEIIHEYENDFEDDADDMFDTTESNTKKENDINDQPCEQKWKKSKNRIKNSNAKQTLPQEISQLKLKEPYSTIIDSNKSVSKDTTPYNTPVKMNLRSKMSDGITKTADLTSIYKTKPRSHGLSSSQPIPKSKLIFSPYQLSCSSASSISMNTLNKNNSSRQKFIAKSSLSNTVLPTLPNKLKIQSSLSHKKSRPSGPMKAIHNSNMFSNDMSAQILADNHSNLERKLRPRNKVWKSASTTDLHRQDQDLPREISDYAYNSWLQDKRKSAAAVKREQEILRQTKEVDAAAKYSERKRLAEEAFQQWLNKKKEQVYHEKKLKAQQRRLDHQTNYAKSTNQCNDAYQEWYKRKQEEMALRKNSGTAIRSRSLERTWMQDKTKQLYNAYLPRK